MRARYPLVIAGLVLLAACAATPGARNGADTENLDPEALLADGDAALERNELPEAALSYRRAAEASDDEMVAEQATRAAFDHSQMQQAALAAERWLVLNPTSEQARRYAGVAALELHRLDAAESHFASLLETSYLSPAAGFLALLPVVIDHGTPPDVTELFKRLAARHPTVAEGQYALGSAALRSENLGLALASAQNAVQKAPYWVPAKMLLARTLIASGKEEAGLESARELVMAPEADVATHLEYALLLAATGRLDEARAMLTPYASGPTVIPGAVRSLGALDLDQGDLDAANARFEDLLSTGAQSYEALYFLGNIADRRDDTDRALRYYTRVTGGDYALAAQSRVARIKAEQSGLDAGLAHLDEFLRGHPQRGPEVVAARAGLASAIGEKSRSLEILDAGLVQYPDSFDLHMARVFAYERAGKPEAAIRELRKLLRDRPDDAVVQNALGYTLADRDQSLNEAAALVGAALAQTPDSAAVLDSMGWVRFRQGRFAEALEYLVRARDLGDDAEIDLHLGEVQWALGNRDQARKTWQEALKRHPENARLRERLERAGP
ncbi:MAG TPA: tetratricopeptide repeat protein [Steroidobacteraceae bacterium]|nr:tetratricopeptide repeat protein [Steroidobacteraceae bacterium]